MGLRKLTIIETKRRQLGITQSDMAKKMDMVQSTYMRIESGQSLPRDIKKLEILSRILKIDIKTLYKELKLEEPKMLLRHSADTIPILSHITDEKIIIEEDTINDHFSIKEFIDRDDNLIFIMPHSKMLGIKEGTKILCRPNLKIEIGASVFLETDQISEVMMGVETVETKQKIYTPCTITFIGKGNLKVDFFDGKETEVLLANISQIYNFQALIF